MGGDIKIDKWSSCSLKYFKYFVHMNGGERFCLYMRNAAKMHGHWGEWGGWSKCSKTCGNGHRTRVRACNSPEHKSYCIFDGVGNQENINCNNKPCEILGVVAATKACLSFGSDWSVAHTTKGS